MFRSGLRNVARRATRGCRPLLHGRTAVASGWPQPLQSRFQKYSSSADDKAARDERLADIKKMDIDAAEKQMKDWLGDHGSWDHEKLLNLQYVEQLISPQDLMKFTEYAAGGYKPGGGAPSYPLMTNEEVALANTPYNQWAPAPYNKLSYGCFDALMPLIQVTDTENDLKTPPWADFVARLQPLKAKIWHGMAPMSRDRWLKRRMDDPENSRNLAELISDILNIFAWLNVDSTQDRMRIGFNFLVDKYTEFEAAANLRREQNGIQERLDFAGMWAEYYQAIISTMSNRTHQWLVDRVDEVQTRAFEDYMAALREAGDDQEAIGTAGKRFFDSVHNIGVLMMRADCLLGVPMAGFKGYTPSNSALDLPLSIRIHSFEQLGTTKSWKYHDALEKAQAEDPKPPGSDPSDVEGYAKMLKGDVPAEPRFRDHETLVGYYHEHRKNRAEMRLAIRGAPNPPSEEYWITILKERMNFYLENGRDRKTHRWGFVCYRLTYKQTDSEWAEFKAKLEADVFKSGTWIEGYDSIADMAGLEYIDGRDVGIPEGDIEAAKRHFTSTYTMLPTLGRMWTQDFLVVDHQSYASYKTPEPEEKRPPHPYGPCFGDRGGFVRLVDTIEYNPEMLAAQAPGFKGEMKVLSTLVLEEVYPLLATFAARPRQLWPLARLHPREVYVGHTIGSQEYWWEWCRIDTAAINKSFFEHLRKKKAESEQGE